MGRTGERQSPPRVTLAQRPRVLLAALTLIGSLAALAALAVAFAGGVTGEGETAGSAAGCPKLILYFSRGSSQALRGPQLGLATPGIELYEGLLVRYGAGNVGEVANPYPAVAISIRSLERGLRIPSVAFYRYSVHSGVETAIRNVADLLDLCPRSKLVLGGYSQGAQVTRGALADLLPDERERVAAVVLFGDPYFDPNDKAVTYFPTGKRSRRGLLLHRPGANAIPIDPSLRGRAFSWCHRGDFVCEGPVGSAKGQHEFYAADVPAVLQAITRPLAERGIEPAAKLHTAHVVGTCTVDLCAVGERSGPRNKDPLVGSAYNDEPLQLVCQTYGDAVTGANGDTSDIWDKLTDGAFIPDFYVNTPAIDNPSPGIPLC